MIFDTVKPEIHFKVNVKNLSQIRVITGLGFLKYKNGYLIHMNNKVHKIEILEQSKLEEIGYFLNTCGYKAIINVIEAIRKEFFTMEIYMFSFPINFP